MQLELRELLRVIPSLYYHHSHMNNLPSSYYNQENGASVNIQYSPMSTTNVINRVKQRRLPVQRYVSRFLISNILISPFIFNNPCPNYTDHYEYDDSTNGNGNNILQYTSPVNHFLSVILIVHIMWHHMNQFNIVLYYI